MNLQAIDRWHKTRPGHSVFGLAELALAYLFASLAIDSGELWQYALALILVFGGVRNLAKVFSTVKNEHNNKR